MINQNPLRKSKKSISSEVISVLIYTCELCIFSSKNKKSFNEHFRNSHCLLPLSKFVADFKLVSFKNQGKLVDSLFLLNLHNCFSLSFVEYIESLVGVDKTLERLVYNLETICLINSLTWPVKIAMPCLSLAEAVFYFSAELATYSFDTKEQRSNIIASVILLDFFNTFGPLTEESAVWQVINNIQPKNEFALHTLQDVLVVDLIVTFLNGGDYFLTVINELQLEPQRLTANALYFQRWLEINNLVVFGVDSNKNDYFY